MPFISICRLKKEDEAMQGKESPSVPGGAASVLPSSKKTQRKGSSEKLVDTTAAAHGHMNPLDWENMPSALRDRLEVGGATEVGRVARPGNI